jgi:hypothetical protein
MSTQTQTESAVGGSGRVTASIGAGAEYRVPGGARALAAACALGVLATSAYGLYLGVLGTQHTAWFIVSFEVVAVLAAAIVAAVARGWFRDGPGMAMLCSAGAIGGGTLLAYKGSAGIMPVGFVLVRAALVAFTLACAAWMVLARNPGPAVRSLVRAAMFGVPLAAILAGVFVMRGMVATLPGMVTLLGGLVGFLLVTSLAAGAVHCTIRAFEVCDIDESGGR